MVKACNGCCCRRRMFSYVGTVYQAVPAAMTQVVRRHMRTRLKSPDQLNTSQRYCHSSLQPPLTMTTHIQQENTRAPNASMPVQDMNKPDLQRLEAQLHVTPPPHTQKKDRN